MLVRVLLAVFLSAASGLGAQAPITLIGYSTSAPASWRQAPTTSSMRLAQFTIPGAANESAAEVIVYYFGPDQGGSVDANLARWKGQFTTPDGKPIFERVSTEKGGRFPITVAEYRGTYARGMGQGNASASKPNQVLVAVIAETPKGALFFQLFGDIGKASPHKDALIQMVRALK